MCELAKMMVKKGFEYIGEDETYIKVFKMSPIGKITSIIPKEISESRKIKIAKAFDLI